MSLDFDEVATNFFSSAGIHDPTKRTEVLSGFDREEPMYEISLWPNDRLFQYMRRPTAEYSMPRLGEWFCLAGADLASLAIHSGGSGRHLTEVRVISPLSALEGVATKMPMHWTGNLEGVGAGGEAGGTQIFIPRSMFHCLEVVGIPLD